MGITVKRLIEALEAFENKYLEVEVLTLDYNLLPIYQVKRKDRKVLLLTDDPFKKRI